jgi:hypothetical protein
LRGDGALDKILLIGLPDTLDQATDEQQEGRHAKQPGGLLSSRGRLLRPIRGNERGKDRCISRNERGFLSRKRRLSADQRPIGRRISDLALKAR